ncbi:MAG: Fur family transcriptional regulator [Terriglobia bacterium]
MSPLPVRPDARPSGRRTKQRQLVLEVMQASDDHPTAAQVYQRVRRRYPGVAYATIYNALGWWVERGEVREFTFGNAATRYDRNHERHDHAICTRCGRLIDVTIRLPRRMLQQVGRRTGLRIASHHVQFLGRCADCALPRRSPQGGGASRAD